MFRLAKRAALAAVLLMLMPATIVCDVPVLDDVYDAVDFEVYYDDHYYDDCWLDCDDGWSFDFDWWW